ncbi:uncharacterized protein PHALS_11423 [Plasmopara halstedii]|uniref:Uncharacterized protein n=1 Tax=Plasmopara halstedii TaxID=4781 RepID=A0A0N7L3D2_PLAHL|nr:uncharacterized protein PHALS_11423 [Plasmopara halstedii]CEG35547.1 hypothetical protein PHALS_11423 [Plasmopara halstedii]|eukprot:XP_024571916.1 hypothetical protein PHALS_11423 [Plasmopara halstedii]
MQYPLSILSRLAHTLLSLRLLQSLVTLQVRRLDFAYFSVAQGVVLFHRYFVMSVSSSIPKNVSSFCISTVFVISRRRCNEAPCVAPDTSMFPSSVERQNR